jgi:hypothetical protein
MTSMTPNPPKPFPENSIEKQIYNLINSFDRYLPIPNDRNRLSYCLYKYLDGEGDAPRILVKNQKMKIVGITEAELTAKIEEGINNFKR